MVMAAPLVRPWPALSLRCVILTHQTLATQVLAAQVHFALVNSLIATIICVAHALSFANVENLHRRLVNISLHLLPLHYHLWMLLLLPHCDRMSDCYITP